MMNKEDEIAQKFRDIIASDRDTDFSKNLREITTNREYINKYQLTKLLKLHDQSLKGKCYVPLNDLYTKYKDMITGDGELQNEAALIDRDLRIIESTIELIKERDN